MTLKIALAQLNFSVGAIAENAQKIIHAAHQAKHLDADIIVFPELCITGYPPEDLLLRADFLDDAHQTICRIASEVHGITLVIGYPQMQQECLYNCAVAIRNGITLTEYHKRALPNYGVFDERRYFQPGTGLGLFDIDHTRVALAICEDLWTPGIIAENSAAGADLIISLNASPFHAGKIQQREDVILQQAQQSGIAVVYVNAIGGQDELIFDGASFVANRNGEVVYRAAEFEEQLDVVTFEQKQAHPYRLQALYSSEESVYRALVLGIRDYVRKNGFKGALLGLSGGIDSALTLALAVDALGADQVEAVLMPSRYTQDMSNEDAVAEAQLLGVQYHSIAIEPAVQAFSAMLAPIFADSAKDTTEENIQARCRGVILMALSNKQGKLLLTTGNKSEMSVGYATLYGDMAGGFAPLKDVSKQLVYQLAEYRNRIAAVIPRRVIERAPSAELAPDQKDQDSLPPYEQLDAILALYIEQDKSAAEILALGFAAEHIQRAISLVDKNEYKRRQSPPGVRITPRAFGRDRRYPISSAYRGVATLCKEI
jgi:NAD+ synthase (glutamine-hydrolysing)